MNITTRIALGMVAIGMVITLATTAREQAQGWLEARERAAYEAGWQARERAPVCWALTEDSVIRGCEYRRGAWWIER